MSTTATDPRIDRLYQLLPAIHRMRDAEQDRVLQALLRVIAEQVNAVEDGIAQQYENWFIETAADWAVPYIADLIGYRPVTEAGHPENADTPAEEALARVLVPRREVANTIRYRRRKGTLALLEGLANDIAGWPAHAVEFYRLLGWNQNINHPHEDRARIVDLRSMAALDRIDTPFDTTTRSADIRRIDSSRTRGRHNIPSVGVFVWRLRSFPVTRMPAHCAEEYGPHCFTFSVLGQDAPLFTRPAPLQEAVSRPMPIRRQPFQDQIGLFHGAGRSLTVWAEGWGSFSTSQPIPATAIIPADLSDWFYVPPLNHVAIDPVLGRLVFPPSQLPRRGVRVSYQYGFSADMGGGEYPRRIDDPSPRDVRLPELVRSEPVIYRVGRGEEYPRLGDAIGAWRREKPWDAVIEIQESGVYVEPIVLKVPAQATLTLRAASGARPVIRLLDWQTDLPDSLSIVMGHGSQVTLDGLLITGRGVAVSGPERAARPPAGVPLCDSRLRIRHCTLVPGWSIGSDCTPDRPAEASLDLFNVRADVAIEHSILGSILVREDEVQADPIDLRLTDSILDASDGEALALGALEGRAAHANLTVQRCTVFGVIQTHAMILAENSIFNDCVHVARRQIGCMRYCYVPAGCRTPRRHACQPDLVAQAVREKDPIARAALVAAERIRVRPAYTDRRYGQPAYAQLSDSCAEEIRRGADDESEMGVFHDLFQPQRAANLAERLDEYTPAGMDAGLINAS